MEDRAGSKWGCDKTYFFYKAYLVELLEEEIEFSLDAEERGVYCNAETSEGLLKERTVRNGYEIDGG